MSVLDKLKKELNDLNMPPPPPPPSDSLIFPEIPSRNSLSEPEPDIIKERVPEGRMLIPEPREVHFRPEAPVFVSLSDFNKINENLLKIRSIVESAEDMMKDLDEVYEKQQKIMLSWVKELETVEKKISRADEIIHSHEKK